MRIFVCVKQVPDTSGVVAVNPDGTLNRASMQTIINPDDLIAMEQALVLKDNTGCQVTAVTMGPPPAEGMLRELLAMGADDAILISAREFGGSDTFATSQIISAAINHVGYSDEDMIFCGRQAIDGDTAQVGPQIAEKLGLPQISYVAEIKKDGQSVTCKRMLEDFLCCRNRKRRKRSYCKAYAGRRIHEDQGTDSLPDHMHQRSGQQGKIHDSQWYQPLLRKAISCSRLRSSEGRTADRTG